MAGRLIFHCDGNNFFASCECIEHPEWRDVPMAVAGDPKDRCGIVVAPAVKREDASSYFFVFVSSNKRSTSPKYVSTSSSVSFIAFCSISGIFFGRTRA